MALLATTLFLLFGIVAAFKLAKSMSRPIAQLSACATALKNGDDSVRATIETSDELGDLALSFNSMIEAIRMRTKDLEEALEELYQLNIALEDKVQKRTAQLELANSELESFNYSASHDLRAPLTRLAGFCDALREEYGEKVGAGRKRLGANPGQAGGDGGGCLTWLVNPVPELEFAGCIQSHQLTVAGGNCGSCHSRSASDAG